MSSNTTGDRKWAAELTATTRAPPAAASARCKPVASAKWPRWLVANCISQPSAVRASGDERRHRLLIGQVQRRDPDLGVAGRVDDLGGGTRAGLQVAYGEDHLGPGRCQGSRRLDADAGGAAGHDGALAAQVDAVDHLGGGGLP